MITSQFIISSVAIMSITVDFQAYGVDIRENANSNRVFLEPATWEIFMEYKNQIEQAFKLKKEQTWQLQKDEKTNIIAHTNSFKNKFYLHIRHWWQERPTKMGITVKVDGWMVLKSHMSDNPETVLGKSVFIQILSSKMSKLLSADCEGCEKSWASQRDHECLTNAQEKAELCIDKAVSKIKAVDFIKALAEEAWQQDLVLETPHQTLKRILQFHIRDIKTDVLGSFDYVM